MKFDLIHVHRSIKNIVVKKSWYVNFKSCVLENNFVWVNKGIVTTGDTSNDIFQLSGTVTAILYHNN